MEFSQAYIDRLNAFEKDLSHEDLKQMYGLSSDTNSASQKEEIDLNACEFWKEIEEDPSEATKRYDEARKKAKKQMTEQEYNSIMYSDFHHPLKKKRVHDFRLTQEEKDKLSKNGFVVSQKLSTDNFANMYYQLYTDDMPVYITSDSVLHAWHRSFDELLVQLEEQELKRVVEKMLIDVMKTCSLEYDTQVANKQVIMDVDLYFGVALALLEDATVSNCLDGNNNRLDEMLSFVKSEQLETVTLFGSPRMIDFSLFKPRGHYVKKKELQCYFKAMMWLGTIDFRVAGLTADSDNEDDALYQLQCSVLILKLIRKSGHMSSMRLLDSVLALLIGKPDSMTPSELDTLVQDEEVYNNIVGSLNDPEVRENTKKLQQEIVRRGFGRQAIVGHPYVENFIPDEPTSLPHSFCVLGQRFVLSSFVLSKVVFDNIIYNGNKVHRRIPSGLDVAFALMGNNVAVDELVERMTDTVKGVPFRDGLPYASNLIALRQMCDGLTDKHWQENFAAMWVDALRELSNEASSNSRFFHTNAWKEKQMTTQLASWTQLRHDTILYAKQSCTMMTRCEFVAAYVDPYPKFWNKMKCMAARMAEVCKELQSHTNEPDADPYSSDARNSSRRVRFYESFADTMGKLESICLKQCEGKDSLNEEDTEFLKDVIEKGRLSGGSKYGGWYPGLFLSHRDDAGKADRIVADVHTDFPSVEVGDPGCVLHLGVGNVNMGIFIVEDEMEAEGKKIVSRKLYCGPVLSSYEFLTPINERLTDEEFEKLVEEDQQLGKGNSKMSLKSISKSSSILSALSKGSQPRSSYLV